MKKIEYLEMQVEAELIRRSEAHILGIDGDSKNEFKKEIHGWMKLFQPKFRDRVLIGAAMMFFQRKSLSSYLLHSLYYESFLTIGIY